MCARDPGHPYIAWMYGAVRRLCAPPPARCVQSRGGRALILTGTAVFALVRVHPVAVLLSTLQLSRCLFERLFRSLASAKVLLHTLCSMSSGFHLNIATPFRLKITRFPVQ